LYAAPSYALFQHKHGHYSSDNESVLKKGMLWFRWGDYVFGPSWLIPGLINILELKQ
jgi:hypothetical protein